MNWPEMEIVIDSPQPMLGDETDSSNENHPQNAIEISCVEPKGYTDQDKVYRRNATLFEGAIVTIVQVAEFVDGSGQRSLRALPQRLRDLSSEYQILLRDRGGLN